MTYELSQLEPGISNSVTNVKFELSAAKIAQIKQQMLAKNLCKADAEKLITDEVTKARQAFDILVAGSEGKTLLESRLQRVMAQSVLES